MAYNDRAMGAAADFWLAYLVVVLFYVGLPTLVGLMIWWLT